MSVWAIVYSNYEPAEVHSIWISEERAEEERIKLITVLKQPGPWHIQEWEVGR